MNFLETFPKIIEKTYSNYKDVSFSDEHLFFPFLERKRIFFGKRIISLPFLDRVIFYKEFSYEKLKEVVEKLGKNNKIEIRISEKDKFYERLKEIFIKSEFKETTMKGHLVTDLTNEEDLWNRFHKHTRNDIRKAEKSELELKSINNIKELKKFYSLYLREMKNFGTPQHSYLFFKNCMKLMENSFYGMNCYKNKKIIGSIILFIDKNDAYVSFNVSDSKYREFKPNDLLYWTAIKECLKRKILYFDIGQVDLNAEDNERAKNLLKFKQKWLGKVYKKYYFTLNFEYYQDKKDSLKKYRKIWKRLPMPLIKLIGPRICRELGN